jgi:hypothetical protein
MMNWIVNGSVTAQWHRRRKDQGHMHPHEHAWADDAVGRGFTATDGMTKKLIQKQFMRA